jgi:nitrate reductase NapE component
VSSYLLGGENVGTPTRLSFFKNVKKHLLENEVLRFLLFIEKVPKHRVMESINILFLAFLSIGCFAVGLAGFVVWAYYAFFGFLLYYVGVLFVLLELLHCLFDR